METMKPHIGGCHQWRGLDAGGPHWGLLPGLFSIPVLLPLLSRGYVLESTLMLMACLVAAYDIASYRIPNSLNLIIAISGLLLVLALEGPAGMLMAFLAGLTGFAFMALLYFMGAMGAGDVKALAALAVFTAGPLNALQLIVLTALAGGVLALVKLISARNLSCLGALLSRTSMTSSGIILPYGVAIWAGAMGFVCLNGGPP